VGEVSQLREFLSELGIALNATGTPVTGIVERLRTIARRYGAPQLEIVVLPTALLVGVPGAERGTVGIRVSVNASLRLDQIAEVIAVADDAAAGRVGLAQARRRLTAVPDMRPRYGLAGTLLGYPVFSLGLAMFLQPTAADLLVVALAAAVVGVLLHWLPRLTYPELPMPVLVAFVVSVVVFLMTEHGLTYGPLPLLVATLVIFLPGSTLTTGTIDISAGEMIAGSARLVVGAVQLGLLAFGIVAAAQVVGLPTGPATVGTAVAGAATPWIGVLIFGMGVHLHLSGGAGTFLWSVVVLYAAYAAQVMGAAVLGSAMSGFVGAAVMVVVAASVARLGGPAPLVGYLPAFWLLVPGAIGLLGVTEAVGHGILNSAATLVTTLGSIVSVALGMLVGSGVVSGVTRVVQVWPLTGGSPDSDGGGP
jgi:uncharacterized membrane protein YjjP (DUF1212 family)